jgi:hypothetical protein
MLFFLFVVESPVIVFGWVFIAFVRSVGDCSRDRGLLRCSRPDRQFYPYWYHPFKIVDRVLLVRSKEVSVLVRKYETKAQSYENPDDKAESELA